MKINMNYEDLPEYNPSTSTPPYQSNTWTTRDGVTYSIDSMSPSHLANTISYIARNGYHSQQQSRRKIKELANELARRCTEYERRIKCFEIGRD